MNEFSLFFTYFGTDVLKWGRIDQWETNKENILKEKEFSIELICL